MPLYEYKCDKCSKHFEFMQGINEPSMTVCPECKGALSKVVSVSSFQLKGSGWYITDYKNQSCSSDKSSSCSSCCKAGS